MNIINLFFFALTAVLLLYILYTFVSSLMKRSSNPSRAFSQRSGQGAYDTEECSICLNQINYKVELECQHVFCAKCIMEYYDQQYPRDLICPLCRKQVNLINMLDMEKNEENKEVFEKIVTYNYRHLQETGSVKLF